MSEADIQRRFVRQLGVRIEPEMARYVMQQTIGKPLSSTSSLRPVPIMGADARTGMPLRRVVNVQNILTA